MVVNLQVLHERDGACCQAQEWVLTALRINKALADDGCAALWAFLGSDREPSA